MASSRARELRNVDAFGHRAWRWVRANNVSRGINSEVRVPACLAGSQGFESPMPRQINERRCALSIKEMVSEGKQVHFLRYQQGELWYVTDTGFDFPVPLADTGSAAFKAHDKALLFMRWIRKHVAWLESVRTSQVCKT